MAAISYTLKIHRLYTNRYPFVEFGFFGSTTGSFSQAFTEYKYSHIVGWTNRDTLRPPHKNEVP